MNATTTNQDLIEPVLEVLGANLTSYLSAMGMVILHYDCILTLEDEVCPVLSRPEAFASSHAFFSEGAPCLARGVLLPKGPVLPQSVPTFRCYDILQLSSVASLPW